MPKGVKTHFADKNLFRGLEEVTTKKCVHLDPDGRTVFHPAGAHDGCGRLVSEKRDYFSPKIQKKQFSSSLRARSLYNRTVACPLVLITLLFQTCGSNNEPLFWSSYNRLQVPVIYSTKISRLTIILYQTAGIGKRKRTHRSNWSQPTNK